MPVENTYPSPIYPASLSRWIKLGQPAVDPVSPLNILLEASTDGIVCAQTTVVLRRLAE